MKHLRIGLIILTILQVEAFAGATEDFVYKVPAGWVFKRASFSKSGIKAVMLLQGVPYLGEKESSGTPSRLLIFDKDNAILNDMSFPEPKGVEMTRDDHIILMSGIEGVDNITVLDSQGRHLFDVNTGGRGPIPALLGKEIGLARSEFDIGIKIVGAVSIIDGMNGRELATFGPPRGRSITSYSGFLPIGENGQFFIAIGATVFLRSYLHPETPLWKIDNIGGNIGAVFPIDENHIGVAYEKNDFHADKYLAGVAVLDRHDGKILFRHESQDPKAGAWKFLHGSFDMSTEEGDLYFTDYVRNQSIRIPQGLAPSAKWDIQQQKIYKAINILKSDERTNDSRHVIKSKRDVLQIAKIQYVEEAPSH